MSKGGCFFSSSCISYSRSFFAQILIIRAYYDFDLSDSEGEQINPLLLLFLMNSNDLEDLSCFLIPMLSSSEIMTRLLSRDKGAPLRCFSYE